MGQKTAHPSLVYYSRERPKLDWEGLGVSRHNLRLGIYIWDGEAEYRLEYVQIGVHVFICGIWCSDFRVQDCNLLRLFLFIPLKLISRDYYSNPMVLESEIFVLMNSLYPSFYFWLRKR